MSGGSSRRLRSRRLGTTRRLPKRRWKSSTSARAFRAYLRRRGIKATISERIDQLAGRRRRREQPCGFDRAAYRRRNVVERCFHRLKQWRGIATRYDKHPDRYLAAITLASTLIWLDR
ncbi:transposase [Streptomyces seoulensis]|uniref:transposase n=1 Tax=Streptomyces seoulensis TaxID=73044 RepID=UPI003C2B4664